jgi:hypothetical protein
MAMPSGGAENALAAVIVLPAMKRSMKHSLWSLKRTAGESLLIVKNWYAE